MTRPFSPSHKDDFNAVYNLDDPRPYYRALGRAHYRMPGVLCAFLRRAAAPLAAARRKARLRVVDFACGYGTNGALLRHTLGLDDLYAYFDRDTAGGGTGTTESLCRDRRFFSRHRERDGATLEIGGIDIAPAALRYALEMGFVDAVFAEDLTREPPTRALAGFLHDVDIVIETGSIGPLLHRVFPALCAAAGKHPPWFIYCPRPDVDWRALERGWRALDYVVDALSPEPVRYRQVFSAAERADVLRLAGLFDVAPARALDGPYILTDLVMARPRGESLAHPARDFVDGCGDIWAGPAGQASSRG